MLATFTVINNSDAGTGSLRQAVLDANAANGADDIVFDIPGVNPNIILDTGELLIDDELIITGLNGPAGLNGAVTVNVSNTAAVPSRIFFIDATDVTITDLSIGNGMAVADGVDPDTGLGGAIFSDGANLTIVDSLINNSDADDGGGAIYTRQGTLTIQGSEITGNEALDGGAVVTAFTNTTVERSTFSFNTASRNGGGVFVQAGGFGSQFRIDQSEFIGNVAQDNGGGVFNNATFAITNSTFYDNDGDLGGGVYNNGTLEINNSTLTANKARVGGGAFNNLLMTVTNSTLTQNEANDSTTETGHGGGISTADNQVTYLFNSIVAGNLNNGFANDIDFESPAEDVNTESNNNLIGDADSAGGLIDGTNGNIVGDAGLGTLDTDLVISPILFGNGGATRTHQIVRGGLAHNAGDNNRAAFAGLDSIPDREAGDAALDFDQRGGDPFRRIFGGVVDIGAFEQQPLLVDNNGTENDGDFRDTQFSLVEAIAVANASPGPDEIAFDIDSGSLTIDILDQLLIETDIAIDGTNFGDQGGYITLDGLNDGRIFWVNNTDFGLSNITLTNGWANGVDEDTVDNTGASLDLAGGGILNQGGTVTLERTGLVGNRADSSGAALYNTDDGVAHVINSTVSNNISTQLGGGIANVRANMTVVNSTITGNSTSLSGGGIYTSIGNTAETYLFNSIIAGNSTSGIAEDLRGDSVQSVSANNLIGSSSAAGGLAHNVNGNIVGNAGLGNLDINSVLETTLEDNAGPHITHALIEGSPALDAGDNNLCCSGR